MTEDAAPRTGSAWQRVEALLGRHVGLGTAVSRLPPWRRSRPTVPAIATGAVGGRHPIVARPNRLEGCRGAPAESSAPTPTPRTPRRASVSEEVSSYRTDVANGFSDRSENQIFNKEFGHFRESPGERHLASERWVFARAHFLQWSAPTPAGHARRPVKCRNGRALPGNDHDLVPGNDPHGSAAAYLNERGKSRDRPCSTAVIAPP